MAQKRLLTNGNAFKRTDGRWCGVVWYMDERGDRKRKSFSGTTKQAVNKKITDYIADFNESIIESEETKKTLHESMQKWLEVFKFPSVEIEMIKDLHQERYFSINTPLVCDENGNYTRPVNFRKRYYRILKAAGIETKGLHSLRHTFATNLVNGQKQPDGSIKSLTPRQVADLLGHSTSQITEMYYVKKNTARLNGITDGFEM